MAGVSSARRATGLARIVLMVAACALAHAQQTAPFSYGSGGSDWGDLCQTNPAQSPIDITNPVGEGGDDSKQLDLHYPVVSAWSTGMAMWNDGSKLMVNTTTGNMGYLVRKGVKYPIRELVFRSPSEHTLRGERFAMEMQIVHQQTGTANPYADLIVLSVLFRLGGEKEASEFLDKFMQWDRLPAREGQRTLLTSSLAVGLAAKGFGNGYFAYSGSLTYPPCSGGVQWYILETIQTISPTQELNIAQVFSLNHGFAQGHGNNRDLKPQGDRLVTLHNHKQIGDGDDLPLPPPDNVNNPPENDRVSQQSQVVGPEDQLPKNTEAIKSSAPAGQPDLYLQHGADWTGICARGRSQSPIDILLAFGNPHGDYEITPKYQATFVSGITHAGHGFVVEGNFGTLTVEKTEFPASQLVFHSPAEHVVDGRRSALEVEIFHVRPAPAKSGMSEEVVVLSVLFHENSIESSDFIDSLGKDWPTIPGRLSKVTTPVNLNSLQGIDKGYYSYAGSLTRPPCTEGVKRFVLRTYQEISTEQLTRIRSIINGNYRDLQATNGRGIVVHNVNPHEEILPAPPGAVSAGALLPL